MAIEFICPSTDCNKKLSVPDEKAGKKARCPKCREILVAPLKSGDMARTMAADGALTSDERSALDHLEPVLELRGKAKKTLDSEEEIAQGGMGKVMLCHDQSLERSVAMKIMRVGIADSQEHRLRFLEEAQVTGQLEHPNIVPVHDLGKDEEGNLYFTMKHVKGRSLGEILVNNRSSGLQTGVKASQRHATENAGLEASATMPHLLNVFLKACDAMAFAHSKGVIHRDLKPDNIMVGDYGEVLVMDWGLAKVSAPGRAGSQPARSAEMPAGSRRAQIRSVREAETLIDGGQASSSQPPATSNQQPASSIQHPASRVRLFHPIPS